MPNNDLISRAALLEVIENHVTSVSVCATSQEAHGKTEMKEQCLEDIHNAPAVDAIPVEWLEARIKYAQETGIWEAQEAFEFVLMCWKGVE